MNLSEADSHMIRYIDGGSSGSERLVRQGYYSLGHIQVSGMLNYFIGTEEPETGGRYGLILFRQGFLQTAREDGRADEIPCARYWS